MKTLTIKLVDATSVTVTLDASDAPLPQAKQRAIQVSRGGFFDDAGVFHPASAIVSITIS